MYPGMMHWWKRAKAAKAHAAQAGWGGHGHGHGYQTHGRGGGGGFGVRRPLRFMAHKLDLDDDQVKVLAQILNDLKTERAQASVDDQRTVSAIADALEADSFDQGKAEEGLKLRTDSAQRLRDAVLAALQKTHAMLTSEQRTKLAYLLRSGGLTI